MDDSSLETLLFLCRSDCRLVILEELYENGPATRSELRDVTEVVRTTLQRNLSALLERGLIEGEKRRYTITATGAHIGRHLSAARRAAATVEHVRPVVDRLPAGEPSVDLAHFSEATVIETTRADPYAPIRYHADSIGAADQVRSILSASGLDPLEQTRESLAAGGTHEWVVTSRVHDELTGGDELADVYQEILEHEHATVWITDQPLSFCLGILDDVVQIGIQDDSGVPAALLEAENPTVHQWAVDRFEWARDDARRIDIS